MLYKYNYNAYIQMNDVQYVYDKFHDMLSYHWPCGNYSGGDMTSFAMNGVKV